MKYQKLITRISNGRKWLMTHENHPKYAKYLRLYESLVDEARSYGLKEEDCWLADSLTDEEIKEIFSK